MRNAQRYAVLSAVALLAACGGGDKKSVTGPDGNLNGSFTATMSGDIAGPLSGLAGHAAVSTGPVDEQGFVLAFEDTPSNGTATASIIIARKNPALPATGQIAFKSSDDDDFGPNDYVMLAAVADAQGTNWLCVSSGGSMTVSASSAARIRGTISITASCITAGSEVEKAITLSGNFDSRQETVPQLRAGFAMMR